MKKIDMIIEMLNASSAYSNQDKVIDQALQRKKENVEKCYQFYKKTGDATYPLIVLTNIFPK